MNGRIVDNFLSIRNRNTGETLRLSRVRDSEGQIVLNLEGSLPQRASGRLLTCISINGRRAR